MSIEFKEKIVSRSRDLNDGYSISCVGVTALNYPLKGGNYFSMYMDGDDRTELNILNMSYENYKYIFEKLDIDEIVLLEIIIDGKPTNGFVIINEDIPDGYFLGCLWLYGTNGITKENEDKIINYLAENEFGIRAVKEPELTDEQYKELFKGMMTEKFKGHPVIFDTTTDIPHPNDIVDRYEKDDINRHFLELIRGNNYMWIGDSLNMRAKNQEQFNKKYLGGVIYNTDPENRRKITSIHITVYDTEESLEGQKYHVDFERGLQETKTKLQDLTGDGLRHIYTLLKDNPIR
jgi:hypothetical protein